MGENVLIFAEGFKVTDLGAEQNLERGKREGRQRRNTGGYFGFQGRKEGLMERRDKNKGEDDTGGELNPRLQKKGPIPKGSIGKKSS